jgi:glycosyltransferase involved in cell wall biosynthesis
MRILMPVLHYYPVIGGLETWTKNIAERLAQRDQVFIITGKVINTKEKEVSNNVNIFRASLYYLSNLSHSSFLYIVSAMPFIFLKSLSLIRKEKIDVLHCQGFASSFLGYTLSKLTNIPYVVTVQRIEESKGFLRRLVYSNASLCIAASNSIENYFKEIGVKKTKVIPNGVNIEQFKNIDRLSSRQELGLKDEFVITTVARLERVKGIEYLIKAAGILNKKFKLQISSFKLLIIGDGSERNNLENLINELKLGDTVKLLGQIENNLVPKYLSAVDLFVLPSIREGFGIVILEAMAARLPAIATRVGGVPDIVRDKQTGILVEPESPEEIAKAILTLYKDRAFGNRLAESAIKNIDYYNWDNITERVRDILENILNRKSYVH